MLGLVPWFLSAEDASEFRFANLFTDHVVLQRETQAPVWGWAEPGAKITLTASWMKGPVQTVAGEDGKWVVKLRTGAAGTGHRLSATNGRDTLKIEDVAIGEVWLMGGQSNMEWYMDWCNGAHPTLSAAEVKQDANRPGIRYFLVEKNVSPVSLPDVPAKWRPVSPESVGTCSAVAYWFARRLHEHLEVPVGLLNCAYGGSEIEQWLSDGAMRKIPAYKAKIDAYETAMRSTVPVSWRPTLQEAPTQWTKVEGALGARHYGGSEFTGEVWYRATFDAPASGTGSLQLGPIDYADMVWLNGEKVGGAQGERLNRVYPARYKVGKNELLICVYSPGVGGGLADGAKVRLGSIEIRAWEVAIGKKLDAPPAPRARWSTMKQAMLDPLAPYAIRGMAWYQGESNVGRSGQYETALRSMIGDWRRSFGRGKPFGIIQIAPFRGYGDTHDMVSEIREAQARVAKDAACGLVVTTDLVDNPDDIHPRDKFTVGWRLATWALRDAYGLKGFAASSPSLKRSSVEGGTMRIEFDAPVRTRDRQAASEFQIAGPDHKFYPATVVLEKSSAIVSSPQVPKPVAVRFAWASNPTPNLVGESGWPVVPFRTDRWPINSGGW